MAPKNKPAEEPADMDLTKGVPEELLPGDPEEEGLALREPMSLLAAPGEIALPMDGIRPPFLQLAHATSTSLDMERFNAGDLVLNKDFLAAPKGTKLDVIILNLERYFKEYLTQDQKDEGRIERRFASIKEAAEAGLNMEWGPQGSGIKPQASVAFDMILLIRKPDGVESGLYGINIGIDDADGNPTEWAIARASYDKINGNLMKNDLTLIVNTKLRNVGIYGAMWEFYTAIHDSPSAKFKPFVVRAKFKHMLPEHVRENIRGVLEIPVSVKDDPEFP